MSLSQDILVRRFRDGGTKGRASSMFIEGEVLYSWGVHFPLALRLLPDLFVLNADRRSISTSRHQSICRHFLSPMVAVAASAFPFSVMIDLAAGPARLVDYDIDDRVTLPRTNQTGWTDADRPADRRGYTCTVQTKDDAVVGEEWHRPGGTLITSPARNGVLHAYLSGIDEGSYFVCQLPQLVETLADAYDSLMPTAVRRERDHGRPVRRQGEWFFIPTDLRTRDLPQPSDRTSSLDSAWTAVNCQPLSPSHNKHKPREIRIMDGHLYCRGHVWHRDWVTDRSTGEHRVLSLGEQWHQVERNLAVQSWNASGGFD